MAPTIERSRTADSRERGLNLTPFGCSRIVQAYEDGRTLESIAEQFQRARSTISRIVRGVSQHNEGLEQPRTGRPRQYSPRDQLRLENAVKKYPFWSYSKIARVYRFSWSVSTMR
jgi:transposase